MILIDTSGLLAAIDSSQRQHIECANVMSKYEGPFLLSPFILAELDYLLGTRVSANAELALLSEVARGAYRLESFGAADVAHASAVVDKYKDLEVGLADASIVVLANRYAVRDVLTLDRRHFGALRWGNNRRFRVVP